MILLSKKLIMIVIIIVIAIGVSLVFVIPADNIDVQPVTNNEKLPVNHTLSFNQTVSVSEANNQIAIDLFKLLETDTKKTSFFHLLAFLRP